MLTAYCLNYLPIILAFNLNKTSLINSLHNFTAFFFHLCNVSIIFRRLFFSLSPPIEITHVFFCSQLVMESGQSSTISDSEDVHKYGVIVGTKLVKPKDTYRNGSRRGANAIETMTSPGPSKSGSCQNCRELARIGELPVEIFRYKVVYPGGVFVRVSPALDAEKTGVILEFGNVFEATKSLVLDGINYAKLSDDSGWVFGNKGGTEVLELLEVIRVPRSLLRNGSTKCAECTRENVSSHTARPKNGDVNSNPNALKNGGTVPEETGTGEDNGLKDNIGTSFQRLSLARAQQERNKLFQVVRVENRFWREIRGRCGECITFDQFFRLACSLDARPPAIPEPGPARSAWMAESTHDEQIRACISLIASITRQCADTADTVGLESCLWVSS